MAIWTLADLHLAFSNPDKSMEFFGPAWKDYPQKIEQHWRDCILEEDLVLLPGDTSWAMKLKDALIDLQWIDQLPGTKLLSRGNHDYWWSSTKKMREALPKSIHFIHNNAFDWGEYTFGGVRLWDTDEYSFDSYIEFVENPREKAKIIDKEEDRRIFSRELDRLVISLEQLNPKAKHRVALIHYPPIAADLSPSRTSAILEQYGVEACVFGHLHNVRENSLPFGAARGVRYLFASADYLGFAPLKVFD